MEKYPSIVNISLAHNVEKVLAVHQVLAAVAMFFNSLEFVPEKED